MSITDFLVELTLGAGLGLGIWAIALAMPFRRLSAEAEVPWDLFTAACGIAFAVAAEALFDAPTDGLSYLITGWYDVVYRLPWWAMTLVYIVLSDLGAYWAHRALHTRALWATHALHHSPERLYWLSGLRGSLAHSIILLAPYSLVFVLFPVPEIAAVGIAVVVFEVANQHYIHSNLWFPFARWLEYAFVTPRYHFVHHSKQRVLADSNYGFIFSVWDRIFGTFTDPDTVAPDDELGLNYDIPKWRLLLGIDNPKGDAHHQG